jgi:hypothetical protein
MRIRQVVQVAVSNQFHGKQSIGHFAVLRRIAGGLILSLGLPIYSWQMTTEPEALADDED